MNRRNEATSTILDWKRGEGSAGSSGSRSSVESIGKGASEELSSSLIINNNNAAEMEPAEYIVDRTTRTTYLKGKFLGKGGFARVHELTDLTTNKVFAGKIIAKSHITQPHHREKIAREVELQKVLLHRHVVRFRHYFEDDLNVYIILENCSRKSLVHVMKNRCSLTEPEVRYYMKQLVDGVEYIHKQNVIHRDLKLGNMFLTDDMVLKVGDFGLATRVEQQGPKKTTICGTPNYIAPEVLNKDGHGFPADIWAIGCIMYAMLVGQPPFETATLKETYIRIMTNNYVIPPLISAGASNLISCLLHPTPNLRPTLDQVRLHDFFQRGFCPELLSPSCTTTTPRFPRLNNNNNNNNEDSSTDSDNLLRQLVSNSCPRITALDNQQQQHELKRINSAMSQLKIRNRKGSTEVVYRTPPPNNSQSFVSTSKEHKLPRNSSLREVSSSSRREKDTASLHSAIKLKITSVLCPDKNSRKIRSSSSAANLFHVLNTCLENMPDEVVVNPPCTSNCPIQFVTKWIDYSNKYGFGFQLSDRSVGVLFNDSTRIGFNPDRSRAEFIDLSGKLTAISPNAVPVQLQERYALLDYFVSYMEENLTEGGETKDVEWGKRKQAFIPHMKRWLRTSRAIIMQLSTGGLQVNFFKDHTKIILSLSKNEYLVTYINEDRRASTYRLIQITNMGCNLQIRERLLYALNILKEFASLDSD